MLPEPAGEELCRRELLGESEGRVLTEALGDTEGVAMGVPEAEAQNEALPVSEPVGESLAYGVSVELVLGEGGGGHFENEGEMLKDVEEDTQLLGVGNEEGLTNEALEREDTEAEGVDVGLCFGEALNSAEMEGVCEGVGAPVVLEVGQ